MRTSLRRIRVVVANAHRQAAIITRPLCWVVIAPVLVTRISSAFGSAGAMTARVVAAGRVTAFALT
jgi:hypothetical protein